MQSVSTGLSPSLLVTDASLLPFHLPTMPVVLACGAASGSPHWSVLIRLVGVSLKWGQLNVFREEQFYVS